MKPQLTILNDPIPAGGYFLGESSRRLARGLRDSYRLMVHGMKRPKYRGHAAVTRSLVEGLSSLGVDFNCNPLSVADLGETVVVLSGVRTLAQAVKLKQEGRIKRLLAGPNILVFPSSYPDLIAAREVDVCITPSAWVTEMYEQDCAALRGRCAAWPAGVNVEYWRPEPTKRQHSRVLIFDKQVKGPVGPPSLYVPAISRLGLDYSVITYGFYKPQQYLDELQRACLMVGFVTDESQGIAWAEAWSADVPTLLWFQDHDVYLGRSFRSSTAPYLADKAGLFFTSVETFEAALLRWHRARGQFEPRQWVLDNMSDEVCARKLCELAGIAVR